MTQAAAAYPTQPTPTQHITPPHQTTEPNATMTAKEADRPEAVGVMRDVKHVLMLLSTMSGMRW